MELEQLKQLAEIRKCGTISAAAESLHLSQPALSRSVHRLEQDLGQELFERTRNRVRFNEAGTLALEHADVILADVRRMREAFDELSRKQRTLKIASVAPAPTWRFSTLALEKDPSTILEPEILEGQEAVRSLLNREVAFAFTLRPIQLPNVMSHSFMTEDLYLHAPINSDLAAHSRVSFSDLDGRPFIVFEQIGFWMDIVHRDLPHSEIIVQKDRMVFMQLIAASGLLCFTTDVPENTSALPSRVSVPIVDADAHATFFLNVMADAPTEVLGLFNYVIERVG